MYLVNNSPHDILLAPALFLPPSSLFLPAFPSGHLPWREGKREEGGFFQGNTAHDQPCEVSLSESRQQASSPLSLSLSLLLFSTLKPRSPRSRDRPGPPDTFTHLLFGDGREGEERQTKGI